MTKPIRTAIIGSGGMARYHPAKHAEASRFNKNHSDLRTFRKNYDAAAKIFTDLGITPPPNQPDLGKMLRDYPLDAAFIITLMFFIMNKLSLASKQARCPA